MIGQKIWSRRRLLAGVAGGTVATAAFVAWGGSSPPIDYPERRLGEAKRGQALVAYTSMFGSTGGIARAIGEELAHAGFAADIRLAEHVADVSPYSLVVVGSAIRGSAWMPAAAEFVVRHRSGLAAKPCAFFLASMKFAGRSLLEHDPAAARAECIGWLDPVRRSVPEVQPLEIGVFAGAIDGRKMAPFQWAAYHVVAGTMLEGDYRDFNLIRTWGRKVHERALGAA
jgi:menaquinone-dependent protoporphyrinogen oxidase